MLYIKIRDTFPKLIMQCELTAMALSKVSPLSNRFPTNSCVTGKLGGSFVHLFSESGLQPFRNWEPQKRSSFQYFAAWGTSPTKPVNA